MIINVYPNATNMWEIATALGTVGAVVVALAISLTQGWRNSRKARRVRHAIAPALIGDLETVVEVLDTIRDTASKLVAVRMSDAREVSVLVNLGRSLVVPSFDRFKSTLPDLGSSIAPKVIETYGTIIRIWTLTQTYRSDVTSLQDATAVVKVLYDGSAQIAEEIKKTITLLKLLH